MSTEPTTQPTQTPAAQAGASFAKIAPVLFGFFIMGFVDVIGIATSNVKANFDFLKNNDTLTNLLPMAVFFWFLVCSVPTSMLMNKIGRKNTVLVSLVVTFVAMLLPLAGNSFALFMIAFALLGIGNAIIQVSLNPLLTNVVSGERLTSSLNYGQFIKAIASFLGPIIASIAAAQLGGWKMIFPIFAACTLISGLWLIFTQIKREVPEGKPSTFGECFALLGDKSILLFFFGILCVVGVDVGMNVTMPKFLVERCDLALNPPDGTHMGIFEPFAQVLGFQEFKYAGLIGSLYFIGRTIGAFVGASLLLKVSPKKFFIVSMIIAIVAAVAMLPMQGSSLAIRIMVFVIGFTIASIFGVIFGAALQRLPAKANEISGLMIMGVFGGGLFSFLMGSASDLFGGQRGAVYILLACMAYLLILSFTVKEKKAQ